MNKKLSKYMLQFALVAGLAFIFGLIAMLFAPASSVYAELPERPEPVTVSDSPEGAQIKLVVTSELAGSEWTAVEWQDPITGDWNVIANDGWQGDLASDGVQYWWVGNDLFGDGPFRWLVYDEKGGDVMYTSESFSMPEVNNQLVTVTVPTVETEE